MESVIEKLSLLSKLNNLNKSFRNSEIDNKINRKCKVSEIDNNLVKVLKISVECNAFDVNEDKQRQCYKQLKCFWPKCRYSCHCKRNLNRHILHHLNKRQFVCEECKKDFNSDSNLFQHKQSVHYNVRQFICSESNCQKSFKLKQLLIRQSKSHSIEELFKCDECDKGFRYKELLLRHKRNHSKQMPFICDAIGCDKRFKQRNSLIAHKTRFHSGIKRHKCIHNNCDKR